MHSAGRPYNNSHPAKVHCGTGTYRTFARAALYPNGGAQGGAQGELSKHWSKLPTWPLQQGRLEGRR